MSRAGKTKAIASSLLLYMSLRTSSLKDYSVEAGALNPGEMTTILGRSIWHPRMILTIAADGEIGWTHIGLLDVSNVDLATLIPLSNDAIDELFGLED